VNNDKGVIMLKMSTAFFKSALLMTGFALMASEAFCNGTVTGSIVTDLDKNKEDAVVYLKGVKGAVVPQKVTIEQHHLTFIPKVTTIPAGSTVEFTNHDKIYHNVFSVSEAKKFNLDTYDPGKPKQVTFDKPGVVSLLCNVHPEMSAWVVVTDNSYAAVSDKAGNFIITDVPAGTYEITSWSEKLKPQGVTTVTVSDGNTARVDIKLGD
jgi:plastocyanin